MTMSSWYGHDPYAAAAAAYAYEMALHQHYRAAAVAVASSVKRLKYDSSNHSNNNNNNDSKNNNNKHETEEFGLTKTGPPITFRPHSDLLSSNNKRKSILSENENGPSSVSLSCHSTGSEDSLHPPRRLRGPLGTRRKPGEGDFAPPNKCDSSPISLLLPEILSLIFTYLDVTSKGRAAQVCHSWYTNLLQKMVWKGTIAKIHLRTRTHSSLFPSLVLRGISHVQVLSLKKSFRELVNGLPHLTILNLSGCYNVSDSALDGAFHKDFPSLTELNLSLCKEVNDNSLGRIATHCKNLRVLSLAGCSKITNTGLLLISWGLKKIERLNLRSCSLVSDHGIGHLTGFDRNSTSNSSPSSSCSLPHLKTLIVQDCQKISDEALRFISTGLPSLKTLNCSFCVSITDTGMKSLGKVKSLENLSLRSCDNLSDIGIGYLTEDSNFNLKTLDISFCNSISDGSAKRIAESLPSLLSLSLSNSLISDSGLEAISIKIKDLKVLNIGQCQNVSEIGLSLLCKNSEKLESIDVYGCGKLAKERLSSSFSSIDLRKINFNLWPSTSP